MDRYVRVQVLGRACYKRDTRVPPLPPLIPPYVPSLARPPLGFLPRPPPLTHRGTSKRRIDGTHPLVREGTLLAAEAIGQLRAVIMGSLLCQVYYFDTEYIAPIVQYE
jgi:hypothetical protein